jgi:hypothetical protein
MMPDIFVKLDIACLNATPKLMGSDHNVTTWWRIHEP